MEHTRHALSRGLRTLSAAMALALSACGPLPLAQRVAPGSPDALRAADALARWSRPMNYGEDMHRTLAMKFDSLVVHAEAAVQMDYYGPRDFRLVAMRADGVCFLDASFNWAGPHVFQHDSSMDDRTARALVADVSRALEPPPTLEGLVVWKDLLAVSVLRKARWHSAWSSQ